MKKMTRKKWLIGAVSAFAGLASIGFIVFKFTFGWQAPELAENQTLKTGKWYAISPEGAVDSIGAQSHSLLKIGKEKEKVIVYFFGGGVSITGETSQQGDEFFTTSIKNQDFVATWGIGSDDKENPFKDWTMVVLPYASGDFHSGTGSYQYTDDEGNEKTVYHQGYTNYDLFMNEALNYVGSPDTLLVTGFSAGGFGTSLLADDVISRFPTAKNVTVVVDSSLLIYDGWHETATTLWKSPSDISDRLTGDNLVLDSLVALKEKRGDSVKILFDSSYRDDTLQAYQAYINGEKMTANEKNGDLYQVNLQQMITDLQANINDVGIFVWDLGQDKKTTGTQHTTIGFSSFTKDVNGDTSIADWMIDAVNGDIETYGLDLFDK